MRKRKLLIFVAGIFVLSIVGAFMVYRTVFGISVFAGQKNTIIYIPTGAGFGQVLDTLNEHLQIEKPALFKWLAEKKSYPGNIKPGRYVISNNMSYIGLINLLRSGRQTPVRLTFNNIRKLEQLAGKIGAQLEPDSLKIITYLYDDSNYSKDGFSKETIISLFIPDTYELYWNTDPAKLYTRMLKEYRIFWNDERLKKAASRNLKPVEVAILASIIDDEVARKDEKPRIAGVYLNRLKRGMPLQACPTIKFALNDFTITRVLYEHLEVISPYNTYKHKGLPPGPVACPSKEGIDAVLNAEEHDYIFFAAKSDFSGYHNFSRTLAEHNRYANQYQKELDRRKIFK